MPGGGEWRRGERGSSLLRALFLFHMFFFLFFFCVFILQRYTPLHAAAAGGHVDAVLQLLDMGAQVCVCVSFFLGGGGGGGTSLIPVLISGQALVTVPSCNFSLTHLSGYCVNFPLSLHC